MYTDILLSACGKAHLDSLKTLLFIPGIPYDKFCNYFLYKFKRLPIDPIGLSVRVTKSEPPPTEASNQGPPGLGV